MQEGDKVMHKYVVYPKTGEAIIIISGGFEINYELKTVFFKKLGQNTFIAVFPLDGICGFAEVEGD